MKERRKSERFKALLDAEYTKVEGGLKFLWVSSESLLKDCVGYSREMIATA